MSSVLTPHDSQFVGYLLNKIYALRNDLEKVMQIRLTNDTSGKNAAMYNSVKLENAFSPYENALEAIIENAERRLLDPQEVFDALCDVDPDSQQSLLIGLSVQEAMRSNRELRRKILAIHLKREYERAKNEGMDAEYGSRLSKPEWDDLQVEIGRIAAIVPSLPAQD